MGIVGVVFVLTLSFVLRKQEVYYATDPGVMAERPESQRKSASPLSLHASSFFKDFAWSKEEKEAIMIAQMRDMPDYLPNQHNGDSSEHENEDEELMNGYDVGEKEI